jgi:L-asparaginase II
VAISPHALYVAVGIGHSLVAMAPSGRQAWSHPAGGSVAWISWAPFGNRIAYVVHRDGHFVLHVIWGNGTNDTVIDRSVRAVRPSWRSDSLAVAYVGAVYDLGHRSRTVVSTRASGDVRHVAFAPNGKLLALATRTDVALLRPGLNQIEDHGQIASIGWTGRWLAVVHGGSRPVIQLSANPQLGELRPAGTIEAFAAQGHGLAVAMSSNAGTRVLVAVSGDRLHNVLQLPAAAHVTGLELG